MIQRRRQRRRQRVVRGHHQKVHVIDDFLGCQKFAGVVAGVAELGEEILARRSSARRNFTGEKPAHEFMALDPPAHRGAGQGHPDDADRGRDHIDEGLVDGIRLRSPGDTEKRSRGEVERQRLDRRIEFEFGAERQGGNTTGDALVQAAEIVAHRLGLEGHRQCLAVGAVMVEVHQHQPARKHAAKDRRPAKLARKVLVLVEQHQLVGLGADHPDIPPAEVVDAVDPAEFGDVGGDSGERIFEERNRPEQRQRMRLQPREMR